MVEFISSDHFVHKLISPDPEVSKSLANVNSSCISKPQFNIKKEAECLQLNFDPYQGFKIKIFCKRASEDAFTAIGETMNTTFLDERPNLYGVPELREYKAHYTVNDSPYGESSDIILVIKK